MQLDEVQSNFSPTQHDIPVSIPLKFHHGNVMMEMIRCFKDPELMRYNITVTVIDPKGTEEAGTGEGVWRDVLTEFWVDFYETCTTGDEMKIPFLRHDFGSDEWMSVGRIIVKGWTTIRYFPVRLAPTLMEEALYGQTMSSLRDCFMAFVSPGEKDLLVKALTDFDSVEQEDLMECLQNHSCKRLPNAENILNLVIGES